MRPVLHFDKFGKRLVLDDVQSDELARVTRSAVFADWVGHAVMLEAIDEDGAARIALFSPLPSPPPQPTRFSFEKNKPTRPHQKQTHRTQSERKTSERKSIDHAPVRIFLQSLLLLLLVVLIAMALYLLNNTEIIWRWLDGLNASSG